jgi:hypothetical protein
MLTGCQKRLAVLAVAGIVAAAPAMAGPAGLVNGGFEDLNHNWTNTDGGYMALYANSTAIAGWTVSPQVVSDIAWGYGPDAGFAAKEGSYYVDLTGFGNDSPNGAIRQTISVVTGQTYTVGFYWANINDGNPGVDIDGVPIALHTPYGVNYVWTYVEGSFVGGLDTTPYFEFYNASPGSYAMLIDAGTLSIGESVGAPEPASLGLFGLAVAGLGGLRRMRRARRG